MARWRLALWIAAVVVGCCSFLSATAGSFRGVIIRGPNDRPGWIWVEGANGAVRKVEVSRAHVVYDSAVPAKERDREPAKSMKAGVEVRVTADQDGDGEWRAIKIEILRIGRNPQAQPPTERAT